MKTVKKSIIHQMTEWDNPIALDGEKIFFTQRKHWITILPLFLSLFVVTFVSIFIINASSIILLHDYIPGILLSLLLLVFAFTLFIKIATEWYFSVYVLTNRRLLEINYTPLNAYVLNDVLLDQVRCTEIDTSTHGILFKYFDIGDINITFDRPTHREAFVMYSIKDFHKLSRELCHWLLPAQQSPQVSPLSAQPAKPHTTIWYKTPKLPTSFASFNEIIPPTIFQYPTFRYDD